MFRLIPDLPVLALHGKMRHKRQKLFDQFVEMERSDKHTHTYTHRVEHSCSVHTHIHTHTMYTHRVEHLAVYTHTYTHTYTLSNLQQCNSVYIIN